MFLYVVLSHVKDCTENVLWFEVKSGVFGSLSQAYYSRLCRMFFGVKFLC